VTIQGNTKIGIHMDIAEKLTLGDDKHQKYNLTINYNRMIIIIMRHL